MRDDVWNLLKSAEEAGRGLLWRKKLSQIQTDSWKAFIVHSLYDPH